MKTTQPLQSAGFELLPESTTDGANPEIVVLYVDPASTHAAIAEAGHWAGGVIHRLRLLAPLVVAYPLTLQEPAVPAAFIRSQLLPLAESSTLETSIEILLCRDFSDGVASALPPHSLVLLGGRRGLWFSRTRRLERRLRRAGHHVLCPVR